MEIQGGAHMVLDARRVAGFQNFPALAARPDVPLGRFMLWQRQKKITLLTF